MGYYTRYELKAEPWPEDLSEAIAGHKRMQYVLETDGTMNDSGKWYDHEKDMREFSLRFPGVLFTLSGEGEEAGDVWRLYVRDGKCQMAKARVTIPKFDERKMK